jgi:protein-S-isoprenylcysteine O-methyltransferase Ste14
MHRGRAVAGSLVFLVVAPVVLAGLVPWLLTGWDVDERLAWPLRLLGGILIAAGVALLLAAFARFAFEGGGTPAPVAPTERLVVGGVYRHIRNPMYAAVTTVIAGQALLLGVAWLWLYAAAFATVTAGFVHWYEEPVLRGRYGEEFEEYRRAVPGWYPRLRPWRGSGR